MGRRDLRAVVGRLRGGAAWARRLPESVGWGADLFDRPPEHSPFLAHVRRQFYGKASGERRTLSRKLEVKRVLAGTGVRTAHQIAELDDLHRLAAMDLPDRFALKYGRGHSSAGVMLLERVAEGSWFCHLALERLRLDDVVARQEQAVTRFQGDRVWLLEEFLTSTVEGRAVPFDYKFYCFRERVALIVQIDRNAYPPAVSLLDAEYRPLRPGADYILRSARVQPGAPIVPLHAAELLALAGRLSCMTSSPFVRVDLYDTPTGPVFGEFTFGPGTTHKRWWYASHAIIDRLDRHLADAVAALERQGPAPIAWDPAAHASPVMDPATYAKLAAGVLAGSQRAADRFASHYEATGAAPNGGLLAGAWAAVAARMEDDRAAALRERQRRARLLRDTQAAATARRREAAARARAATARTGDAGSG